MTDDLAPLAEHLGGLLTRVSPGERRALAARIARDLRLANTARVRRNVEPDGTPMLPRQKARRGVRAKKLMFDKLWRARFLKAKAANGDAASVEFTAAATAVARVHHFGLTDRVDRRSNFRVKYQRRRLLGFSDGDEGLILKRIDEHFA